MASSFPNSVDLFVPKINDVDDVLAEHVNDLQDATKAIEDYLLSQTPDQSQAPVSPGTGKVGQVLSWLANRIKAITGATNWWDSPAATQAALWAKFDPLTGHKHTGAAGDGPHLDSPNILYSSSVSGFTPADVKAALDALAGVRIAEKSSNANGEYVRWENGLQICYTSARLNYVNAVSIIAIWTYPAAFVGSNPVIVGLGDGNSIRVAGSTDPIGARFRYQHKYTSTTQTTLYLLNQDSTNVSGDYATLSVLAIGGWK